MMESQNFGQYSKKKYFKIHCFQLERKIQKLERKFKNWKGKFIKNSKYVKNKIFNFPIPPLLQTYN